MLPQVHKLYVVHSSHPCETVKKALELKGIPYRTVELLIPTHVPLQKLRFGSRTVPALKLDGGEKISGSRAILRRLDELGDETDVIATGGLAGAIVPFTEHIDEVDDLLTLTGLRLLYERNS